MANKKSSTPTKNPPPVGGPILDLIWESPRPGGAISSDSPPTTGGGIYPLLIDRIYQFF